MTEKTTFDQILEQADGLARQGAWQDVLPLLQSALAEQPGHAGVLTGIGTCLIQLARNAEAVEPFREAIRYAPDSPDAYNNLGVALSLTGDSAGAEKAYRDALERDAAHLPSWKNLAVVCIRQNRFLEGMQILAAVVQAHPEDVEALVLLGGFYEEGEEFASAESMYTEALKRQPELTEAASGLERVRKKIAAGSIAKPEHAGKLAGLKNLRPQTAGRRTVFYRTGEVSDSVRVKVPAAALAGRGWPVDIRKRPYPEDVESFDIFLFSRPHLAAGALPLIEACKQAGKRIIFDMDDDFHSLPPDHPGYPSVGPGNPALLRTLEAMLGLADALIVPTRVLADHYRQWVRDTVILPNCWSRENANWERPSLLRKNVHIGWAGTATHREDLAAVKSEIVRTLRGQRDAVLVIGGDRAVYDMFAMLPDAQRCFIAMVSHEDYPVMLSQFDILLAPLRDHPFNRAKSDIKLLEAGIRRIPWVASDLPAYREWEVGGRLVSKSGEWFEHMRTLAADARLRRLLGEEGRAKAETREIAHWIEHWEKVLSGRV